MNTTQSTQTPALDSSENPILHRLTEHSLENLIAVGERMARDGDFLEKLIWQIKAEAYYQFKEATRKYLDDEAKVQGSGNVQSVVDAGSRITELEKLWSSAVALRNRAVHFGSGQLSSDEGHASRWPALKAVYDARQERP